MEHVDGIVFASKDRETKDLLDEEMQRPPVKPKKSVYNIHTNFQRPSGTSESRALRKLRTSRPDIHARVIAEEISPHAGMIEAGFLPRTITVNIDNAQSAAKSLKENASSQFIAELKNLL